MNAKDRIIEAILYIKGDEGITVEQLKEIFKLETVASCLLYTSDAADDLYTV